MGALRSYRLPPLACERANPHWLSGSHLARLLKDCRAGDVQVSSRPLMRERPYMPLAGMPALFGTHRIIKSKLAAQILIFG